MLADEDYAEIRQALIEDVRRDYVGLWVVPWLIERVAPYASQLEVKAATLKLIEDLLQQRLIRAGHPVKSGKEFTEWEMPIRQILDRIDSEWTGLGRAPNIGDVVWFDRVPRQ